MDGLMFGIGFLVFGLVFFGAVLLASKLLPRAWRVWFMCSVIGSVFAYPFLHLVRPSYHRFNELCQQGARPVIVKTVAVDFLPLNSATPEQCVEGPALIAGRGYLGFECKQRYPSDGPGFRYTRLDEGGPACGLECFKKEEIAVAADTQDRSGTNYSSRSGYMAGEARKVTQEVPFWRWLIFRDTTLTDVSGAELAYTTRYLYYPYGPLTILGLASGTAPTLECPYPGKIDPRLVYLPRGGGR